MIQAWLLKQAPLIVISLTVIGAGLFVGNSLIERGRNEVRPMLDKALSERDNLASQLENERAERRRAEEATSAYSKELATLRRRPRSSEPVRVCFDETAPVPAASAAAGNPDGIAALSRGFSGTARGDLEALRELAYQCDEVSARLRALQKWASPSAQTESLKNSN
jgi:hypothetical protein